MITRIEIYWHYRALNALNETHTAPCKIYYYNKGIAGFHKF